MRKLVVFGGRLDQDPAPLNDYDYQTVILDEVPIRFAILEEEQPEFDLRDPKNARMVLTRFKAFSLNYRDKNRVFTTAFKAPPNNYYSLGSEFAGEVVDVGPEVTRFSPGDRVMGNNAYPDSGSKDVLPGVPTNHASKEFQLFHELKLAAVPATMSDEEAASFSIGAQTTYSMIRRLGIHEGSNVIVTAAKSNTSLFAINALRSRNVNVYAISTSAMFEPELRKLGVADLVVAGISDAFHEHPVLAHVLAQSAGFDFAIDPYFDLHFSRLLDVLKSGAKYISCGVYDQYLDVIGKPKPQVRRSGNEFLKVMIRNISVIGNCIGLDEDLAAATRDYTEGALQVIVDSVFANGDVAGFMNRTYAAKDRFGKVVYRYD